MQLRFIAALLAASLTYAQPETNKHFVESAPPPGVIKGVIKAGDRCGVLIAGGRTVYSNDTFSLIIHGYTNTWTVLGFTNNQARLGKSVLDARRPHSTPPNCVPNFDKLVMLLESEAVAYKDASTKVLKEQVMETTLRRAKAWGSSNQLCMAATLTDISMVADETARIKLAKVNRGAFDAIKFPTLFMQVPVYITVPMTKEYAATLKSGYRVLITGTPSFGNESISIVNGKMIRKSGLVHFSASVLGDPRFIGALFLDQIRYDIFDPAKETVPQRF